MSTHQRTVSFCVTGFILASLTSAPRAQGVVDPGPPPGAASPSTPGTPPPADPPPPAAPASPDVEPAPAGPNRSSLAPAERPSATPSAKEAFEAGVAAYDAGNYPLAADQFAIAQSKSPHPDVLINLAQSELLCSRYAAAAGHFAEYLRLPGRATDELAQAGLTDARARTAELVIFAPIGSEVRIDGLSVGRAPFKYPLFVAPGVHKVSTEKSQKSVEAGASDQLKVDLTDGKDEAVVGNDTSAVEVTEADSGGRTPFHAWFLENKIAWVGAGISATSFAISGLAAVTASRGYDAADDAAGQIREEFGTRNSGGTPCGPPALDAQFDHACEVYTAKVDSGDTWKTTSLVTLIVGIVAAGGTVTYYFLDPGAKEPADLSATLLPVFSHHEAGLALTGTF
jgi:hypothetical protein